MMIPALSVMGDVDFNTDLPGCFVLALQVKECHTEGYINDLVENV